MTDPFGWGGLCHIPPPANDQPQPELTRIADEAEAERFRLECRRDLTGEDE